MANEHNHFDQEFPPPHDLYMVYHPRGSDVVIEAYGRTDPSGGIWVLQGSKFAAEEKPSCPRSARDTRDRLWAEEKLIYRDGDRVLNKPVYFEFLSGAACAVAGCAVSGHKYWRHVEPGTLAA